METPNTPSRINLDANRLQSTPASKGSGSSLSALKKFHIDQVHNLVWLDVLTFQLGSFKRFLHHQLSSVGATKSLKESGGRGTMPQIDRELQECLRPIIAAMNAPLNNGLMNTIRTELQNYSSEAAEKHRYSHFVKATNTALLLLADVQIGKSRRCPSKDDDDFLLFMVHDPRLMRSLHKGVEYGRKPDVIAAFQCHIRDIYEDTSDLLEAVRRPPKEPLHWKRALLCVEKKVKRKKIEKRTPNTYSIYNLDEGGYVERTVIETELMTKEKEKEERSKHSHSQSGLGSDSKAGKRPADEPIEPTHAQKKFKDSADNNQRIIEIEAPSAVAQVADYAAEAMYNCFGRCYIVNLLVTDSVINVWYFDHESPIQMTGFDFIDNLPYFFLFLFTLQRFNLADWGYIPNVVDINEEMRIDISQPWDASSPKPDVLFFAEQGIDIYPKFGLNGRATGVASGTVTVQGVKRDHSVVVKLSYQEKSRVREHLFVEEAGKRLKEKQYGDVCDYLPKILGSREYHEFDSDIVRKAVLVELGDLREKAARIPYLIVLPQYKPIASLTTNWTDFLNSFFALVYCHAMLWNVGIEHGDISEANLMWDPVTGKPKICDFDLSHFTGQRPTGFANTGTWAFMALELLTKGAMLGEVQRLYRHDLESFFAVLIWILCRYHDGKLLSNPPLEEWNRLQYSDCADQRKYTYLNLQSMKAPNGLPEDKWKACVNATLLYKLQQDKAFVTHESIRLLGMNGVTLPAQEFYQSINVLGPTLFHPLFETGDGPEFVERLRKRLPNLRSSAPSAI